MARLAVVVLLDGADPAGVVVRVRRDEDLELLPVPLVAAVLDLPPLLPRAAVGVEELDPVVEVPRGDVHGRLAPDPRRHGGRRGLRGGRVVEAEGRPAGEARAGAGVGRASGGAGGGGEAEAEEGEDEERGEGGRGEAEGAAGVGGGGGVGPPAAAGGGGRGEGGLGAEVVVRLRLGGGREERAGAAPAAAGEEGHRRRGRGVGASPDLTSRAGGRESSGCAVPPVPGPAPAIFLSASFDSRVRVGTGRLGF